MGAFAFGRVVFLLHYVAGSRDRGADRYYMMKCGHRDGYTVPST